MSNQATMTAAQLTDAFAKTAAQHPAICKWRKAGVASDGNDTYLLEVTANIDTKTYKPQDLQAIQALKANGKVGVLIVGGIHGDEPQVPEALLHATRRLLVYGDAAMSPTANLSETVDLSIGAPDSGFYKLTLGAVRAIFQQLDLLIYPLVNPAGFDKNQPGGGTRENANDVDINRNFPILWNGLRDGTNAYFAGGLPTGWNVVNPGAAPADQPETVNVIRLMDLQAVSVYLELHMGYGFQIMYPWGFWENGYDRTQRYCNPGFASLPAKPNDGKSGANRYREYLPIYSANQITALAEDIGTCLQLAQGPRWTQPAGIQVSIHQNNESFNAPDLAGGEGSDTMLSKDVCHVRALTMESGTRQTDTSIVTDIVRATVFALCDHVARQLPANIASFRKVSIANCLNVPC